MPKPIKGTHHLRTGRSSAPGAQYLITTCSKDRRLGLSTPAIFASLQCQLISMQSEDVLLVRALTLMPDHLHLVIALGSKLTLSKTIARLKSKTTPVLNEAGLSWQSGFHDHRVRDDESMEPYFRYVHLNPYQAGLVAPGSLWPYTWFRPEDWEWFQTLTDDGSALPEWLAALP